MKVRAALALAAAFALAAAALRLRRRLLEARRTRREAQVEPLAREVSALARINEQLAGAAERELDRRRTIERLERRESELERELAALRFGNAALKRRLDQAVPRETELEAQAAGLRDDIRRLETERDEALELAERRAEGIEALRTQLDEQRKNAREAEAARLIAEENLEAQSTELRLQFAVSSKSGAADDSACPETVESFAELIAAARAHLEHIELPESAERELDALDAAQEVKVWAQDAWDGLRALDEYARNAAEFPGGFWEWCEHGEAEHRWPATQKKLAMKESRTVMEASALRRKREFDVSTEVKDTGRMPMFAHLKIVGQGGENIPRVYFHDDAKGATGKVHIGFIGPHRLVPNTRTS